MWACYSTVCVFGLTLNVLKVNKMVAAMVTVILTDDCKLDKELRAQHISPHLDFCVQFGYFLMTRALEKNQDEDTEQLS